MRIGKAERLMSSLVEFGRVWYDLSLGILALPNPIIVSRRTRMPISTTKIFFGSDRLDQVRVGSDFLASMNGT